MKSQKNRLISRIIAAALSAGMLCTSVPVSFAEPENSSVDYENYTADVSPDAAEEEPVSEVTDAGTVEESAVEEPITEESAAEISDEEVSLMSTEYTYESLKYTVSNNTVTITGCDKSVTNVIVPAQIDGMNVVAIGASAFKGCDNLTNITISEGVTSIGDWAFDGCSRLSSVELPDSLERIEYAVFRGCSRLSSVELPDSLKRIGYAAFKGCSSLSNVELPDSLESSIGDEAFYGCNSLNSIKIPEGVKSIGNHAFYGCNSLNDMKLPEGITGIGKAAFEGCNSLSSIKIPERVTSIGDEAFEGCSSLSSVELPNSLINIGGNAFWGCSNLSNIKIPERVTSIGERAFWGCKSLSSINFPSSLKRVENYAFGGCNITKIYITDVSKYVNIDFVNNPHTDPYDIYLNGNLLEELEIPEGVTSVKQYIFYRCRSLRSIKLPSSLTSIEKDAFWGCENITKKYITDVSKYVNIDFGNNASNPSCDIYLNGDLIEELEIPKEITSIKPYMFNGCKSLKSVNIPKGVTSIGEDAFNGCSSLSSIKIPEGVTNIGEDAFKGCSSLSSIKIPEGVTNIGESTFEGCSNLSSVELPNSLTSIGKYAFKGCSSLSSVELPNSLTSIGVSAFGGCSSLSSIKIPKGVTSIESYTFGGCSSLSSIKIPEGVTSIGVSAFKGCSSLSSIKIPEGVTNIGERTFNGCSNLRSVELPDGLESIGDNAFLECSSLSSVELPNGLESIGMWAFSDCSSLSRVELPNSLTSIVRGAFYRCKDLKDVYYTGTEDDWKNIKIESQNWNLTEAKIHYNCLILDDGTVIEDANTTPEKNEDRSEYIDVNVYYLNQDAMFSDRIPLANAEVTCGETTRTTDSNGVVRFYKNEIPEQYALSAKAEGFVDYNDSDKWMRFYPSNGVDYICMTQKNPEKIYITSLTASAGNDSYNMKKGDTVSVDTVDRTQYTFRYTADWNGYNEGKAYLRGASSGKMLEFKNNELTVVPSEEFDVGENIMFVMYTDDKQKSESLEKIVKVKALRDEYSLKFEPIISNEISKIPFLANHQLKIGFSDGIHEFADDIEVENDKVTFKFSGGKKNKKEKELSIFNGKSIGVKLSGKLEVPLNESADWSGEVSLAREWGRSVDDYIHIFKINYNTMVVVVDVPIPITMSAEFSGTIEGTVGVSGWLKKPNLYGIITPKFKAEVFGGLGHEFDTAEIKAGVYGELTAKLDAKGQTDEEHWSLVPSLEGKYGVKASVKVWLIDLNGAYEAGTFTWDKKGFNATWLGNDVKLSSDNEQWHLAGRDYLENGGGFVGDCEDAELADLDVSNKAENLIYDNIFENAESVIQEINGKNVLLYTIDDTGREEQNGLKLVYSVQNDDGTWTAPEAVHDDGTLDSNASSSGKFVVYEDMKSQTANDVNNLKDILSGSEISAAVFDGAQWAYSRLTDNDVYDFSPSVSSNGDTAIAAWLTNSEGDFSAQSGETSLNYKIYNGSEWSDTVTIENIGKVTRVDTDYDGTNGKIFYKKDNVLYTVSTSDNAETPLEYEQVGQYAVGNYNGKTVLAYFDTDNRLNVVYDVQGEEQASKIDTAVNNNSIPVIETNGTDMYVCWIDHNDGFDRMRGVRYENGEWSEPITFTDDDSNISNPSITINEDGGFTASYFKTGKVQIDDDGNCSSGKTSLYVSKVVPSYNIAIDSLEYNDEAYAKGGAALLNFDVKNTGEKKINGVNVEVYEGEELKQSFEKDIALKAGEVQNVSVTYMPEKKNVERKLTVKVLPKDVEDFDTSDNSADITIGSIDIEVSKAYISCDGGQYFVNAMINNNGSIIAPEATVQIHKGSIDGEVIYEHSFEDIYSNEELYIAEPVSVGKEAENYYITAAADNDTDENNNFSIAVYQGISRETEINVMDDTYSSGNLDLSIKTVNNTDENITSKLVMAAYDSNGRIVKVSVKDLEIGTGENMINESFDCSGLRNGFTFKMFVWNSTDEMQPIGNIFTKSYK